MSEIHIVQANGVRLAYRTWGAPDAPPLLLLHCLGADGSDWAGIAPALATDHRVYALDLRGHGGSSRSDEYPLEQQWEDVAAFLTALGLDRVTLIGHSYGAVVGYLFAQRYPHRIRRLVIEDAPALLPQDPPLTVPPPPPGEEVFDWEVKVQFTAQRNAPDPGWLTGLANITAPTLVIGGGPTSHFPQELMTDLVQRLPQGRLVTIDAGHLVHATRPEEFLAEVRAFLAEPD
ncbi:alpha/beta fold hydrolase [Streptomyces palmae]|uniref:Alpha/beta hydrolase n=1 Tax=Streptomyces palmae TaxID=1701085 RepID=A0A4Z0H032_9ACTN|nr:alpha/beta hydrolase [Streptomyces palmae]TGB02975.1 alpha/beta hydrolase [Streptomyces palmae]